MSKERFIRCKHCGLPHEASAAVCPVTGLAITHASPSRPGKDSSAGRTEHSSPSWKFDAVDLDDDERLIQRLPGTVLEAKYRVDALVGRGGMGAVFRGTHLRIGRSIAIKLLLRGHAKGTDAEKRFDREARIAGSIGHANIVEVFDLGTLENGTPFLIMELLEGRSLQERLQRDGALPVGDVLDLMEQILAGLAAAHDKGIVHRDLKPENVFLVDRHGAAVVKLVDFGVSKNLFEEHTLTKTGAVVGTPYYLAPEQARGEKGVSFAVDVWSAGVLMYECLTGTLPFRANDFRQLVLKITRERPVAPSKLRPMISPELERIVLRALEPLPADRFAGADEMLDAIRGVRVPAARTAVRLPAAQDPEDEPTEISDLPIDVDRE